MSVLKDGEIHCGSNTFSKKKLPLPRKLNTLFVQAGEVKIIPHIILINRKYAICITIGCISDHKYLKNL